ncbi:MAG: hypothetical protein APF80_11230 [Alphaproteobacteria bacterium BRH_c36]|nr:MAG: hypothetical protein APF80_11230 [Alphaproteobacteria bacterium BRH_c36]
MLKPDDLRTWLHQKNLRQLDKLLLVLATFDAPCAVKDIRSRALEGGLRIKDSWNPSGTLSKSNGLAIHDGNGWTLTEVGKQHLRNLGVQQLSPAAIQVANDLRAELPSIADPDTRAFAEEAIKCYEAELYRSAIVMSWLAAVDVLQKHVVAYHLTAFNSAALAADVRWKPAKTADDLGRMKEGDFLDRLVNISVLQKNVKTELRNCLDRRNGCGHPNSLKLGTNTVAHHLEVLLLNVFKVF